MALYFYVPKSFEIMSVPRVKKAENHCSTLYKKLSIISHMCSVTPISRSSLTERRGEIISWPCLSYMSTEKVVSLLAEVLPDPEFRFIMRCRDAEKTQILRNTTNP